MAAMAVDSVDCVSYPACSVPSTYDHRQVEIITAVNLVEVLEKVLTGRASNPPLPKWASSVPTFPVGLLPQLCLLW